ncbi:MAG: hypothetical protein P9L99_11655 [Candidatus Lernaella stagnicola]|nr:hypothetical protein [Candidatus Lernaella stagnicola]
MSFPKLDRRKVGMKSLAERINRVRIADAKVEPGDAFAELANPAKRIVDLTAQRIRQARQNDRPVVLTFGAHTIKNGLGPVLRSLIERDLVTHLATNGAGVIHDWELAYLGETSEHVAANMARGAFGNWEETGFYLNMAINVGAYEGLGYGEAVGKFIHDGRLDLPSADDLLAVARGEAESNPDRAAAALDLLGVMQRLDLKPGAIEAAHPFANTSAQAAAFAAHVPFTAHPMFGHDIIYNHPANCGSAIGRSAERDFLAFAHTISRIDGGVYLSIGSAVMSPMIFEKSFSMAQNLALQEGRAITDHFIAVVDLAPSRWDWSQGEPPEDHPDYYLRFNKTFSRVGGTLHYAQAHNRDFLLALLEALG